VAERHEVVAQVNTHAPKGDQDDPDVPELRPGRALLGVPIVVPGVRAVGVVLGPAEPPEDVLDEHAS